MSKNVNNQQVVHESETQRQFVRLPVPARVTMDGAIYDVRDLSSGGVSIQDVDLNMDVGSVVPLSLHLPFSTFSMDVNLEGQVKYYLHDRKIAGFEFSNLSREQVALVNHVIKSFQAGEIVTSSSVLNVAARDNFTKPRKAGGTAPVVDTKRQIPGLLLVAVMGLAAAGFIGGNLYENVFTLKSSSAVVTSTDVPLRAVADGVFKSRITQDTKVVTLGQVLGSVDGDDVRSPCECNVMDVQVLDGEYVLPGQVIATLVPVSDKPWVIAQVKSDDAVRLGEDAVAQITIAGTGLELSGRVTDMKVSSVEDAQGAALEGYSSSAVQVRVDLDQSIPLELSGRPARVIFTLPQK